MNPSVASRFEDWAKVAAFSSIVLVSLLGLDVGTVTSSRMSLLLDAGED